MKHFVHAMIGGILLANLVNGIDAVQAAPVQNNSEEKAWKIGGKIHFEEQDGPDYFGIITLNHKTRDVLRELFQVDPANEKCAKSAKILLDKQGDHFVIGQHEEKSDPGVGEEMHATLLYTSKRVQNGHETLLDIYKNLEEIDNSLPHDHPPTVEQIATTYQKIINPQWKFVISDITLIRGKNDNVILAKLLFNGKDEIVNEKGHPISGNFLHISLARINHSVLANKEDEDKINQTVLKLNRMLSGRSVKIADKNGHADLEFGITGSSPKERIRPGLLQD